MLHLFLVWDVRNMGLPIMSHLDFKVPPVEPNVTPLY